MYYPYNPDDLFFNHDSGELGTYHYWHLKYPADKSTFLEEILGDGTLEQIYRMQDENGNILDGFQNEEGIELFPLKIIG